MMDHRGAPLNVLAVAALLAVAVRPVAIVDGGFLLSFGATAAIILGVPRVVRFAAGDRVHGTPGCWRAGVAGTAGVLAATLCAEVGADANQRALFLCVTFAGLALNLAAIPLMTAVQCGSLLLLLLALIHARAAGAVGTFVHYAATALVETSRLVSLGAVAGQGRAAPAWWLCATYYALCVAWLLVTRRRRLVVAGVALAGALLVSGLVPRQRPECRSACRSDVLRIVVLDVGQGDATVADFLDGTAILIDAGGVAGTSYDIGGRVVVPALRALGVRRLHALVVTHGDPDHRRWSRGCPAVDPCRQRVGRRPGPAACGSAPLEDACRRAPHGVANAAAR